MTLDTQVRDQVRHRAGFACEYCGVTETDTGGELTVDHFRPRAHDGVDHVDNLVYCCPRCNQYKADYWPTNLGAPALWNPRREPLDAHFLALADGKFYPLTSTGTFTLQRLRLNRPPLVAYRRRRQGLAEESRFLAQYRDIVALLEQLQSQYAALLEEYRDLLQNQRRLLRLLLDD
ncbi:MAG: HNH endonuclease signature motif containing protein [Planctomycetota bacterium]|nr:HNH endonuclease signature motif containing protein [Planctomycetota bacterium]